MADRIDDGGPAYPSNRDMRHNPDWDHEPGMTLRDYFAAKAMQACVADPNWRRGNEDGTAATAYMMADAMLRARGGANG